MNITASISFGNKKVKWASAHNKRKFNHDKNKNINKKISKFNRTGALANYKEIMIPQINKKRLEEQKNKYLKNRQKSRAMKYSSPEKFLDSKHHKNCVCGVITWGNSSARKEFEKRVRIKSLRSRNNPSHMYRVEAEALHHYMHMFNRRHKYIKICRYAIHVDEKFLHAHAEFVGIAGHTKKGKTRFNFSRALRMEMQNEYEKKLSKKKSEEILPNNKVALKRFRAKEDLRIVNMMPHVKGMHLMRTHQASKENQQEHSYSVKESRRASSASSMASSLASSANSMASSVISSANSSADSASNSIRSKAQSLSAQEHNWHSFLSRQFLIHNKQYGSSFANRLANGEIISVDGNQYSGVDLLTHMIGRDLTYRVSGANSEASQVASNFNNYGSLTASESVRRARNIKSNLDSGSEDEI